MRSRLNYTPLFIILFLLIMGWNMAALIFIIIVLVATLLQK